MWAWHIKLFIRIRVTNIAFDLGKSSPHIPKGRFSYVVFYILTDVEDPEEQFTDSQADLCEGPSSSKHHHLNFLETNTVKPVLSSQLKTDRTMILMTNGSLVKVESIAECPPWSILQYF